VPEWIAGQLGEGKKSNVDGGGKKRGMKWKLKKHQVVYTRKPNRLEERAMVLSKGTEGSRGKSEIGSE